MNSGEDELQSRLAERFAAYWLSPERDLREASQGKILAIDETTPEMEGRIAQRGKTFIALQQYVSVFALGMIIGCSGGSLQDDRSWAWVHVTDLSMVVGEWEGTVKKKDATLPEGSVRLMIRDNGTYLFVGQTVSRSAVGAGSLQMRDGRLIGDTERRAVTLALYGHKGQPVIVVDSINLETGERYHGAFTRTK